MRLLNAICLWVMICGLTGSVWAADEALTPDTEETAGQPAEDAELTARAELLAVAQPLHERRYWSVRFDMVMLVPLSDLPAIAIDDPDNDGIPEGPLVQAVYDQDNEFRPAIQYNCPESNTLFEINYLRLQQTNEIGLAPKAGAVYWTPLVSPNFGLDFALSSDSSIRLSYIEFNITMQHSIRRNDWMNYFVDWGFRWAKIDQRFRGQFFNMGGGGSTDDVTIKSVVNMGGLTFGAGLNYEVFSGLNLSGRFGAFMLQGSLAGSYVDVNSGGGTQGDIHQNKTQLVPGLEAAVFLNYNPDLQLPYAGYILFRGGYEMKNYFQVIDTSTFVDDVHDGEVMSHRSSFGLTGYVLSVQFVWPVN